MTPGPWTIKREGDVPTRIIVAGSMFPESGGYRVIADLGVYATDYPGEREGNARLIAAAPDLLAALKELLAAEIDWSANEGCSYALLDAKAEAKAIAAVAKAEGR